MVTKLTIVEQYTKYLDAISKDSGNGIPTLFEKFRNFMARNRSNVPMEFFQLIYLHCIKVTVGMVESKKVFLKNLSKNWSASTLKEFRRLSDLVNKYTSKEDDEDALKESYNALKTLIEGCDDVCLQLYMNLCFYQSDYGKARLEKLKQFDNVIGVLLIADSEEAIDEALGIRRVKAEAMDSPIEDELEKAVEDALEEAVVVADEDNEAIKAIVKEYTNYLEVLKSENVNFESYSRLESFIKDSSVFWLKPHLLLDSYINYLLAVHKRLSKIQPSSMLKIYIDSNCEDVKRLKTALYIPITVEDNGRYVEKYVARKSWLPTLYEYFRPSNEEELNYMYKELDELMDKRLILNRDYKIIKKDILDWVSNTHKYIDESKIPKGMDFLKELKVIKVNKVHKELVDEETVEESFEKAFEEA